MRRVITSGSERTWGGLGGQPDPREALRLLLLEHGLRLPGPRGRAGRRRAEDVPRLLHTGHVTCSDPGTTLAGRALAAVLVQWEGSQLVGSGGVADTLASACVAAGGARFTALRIREGADGAADVEGRIDPRRRVVVIEDVLESARPFDETCAVVERAGLDVEGVVALVHLPFLGAREHVEGLGYRVQWVFDAWSDLRVSPPVTGPDHRRMQPGQWAGESVPEGLTPSAAARAVAAHFLDTGATLRPPRVLDEQASADGGCWVTLRRRAGGELLAREGFWHVEGEESDLRRELVLATVKACRGARLTTADLPGVSVAVSLVPRLEPCEPRDLDVERFGVVVRSRPWPSRIGAVPAREAGVVSEAEQLRRARFDRAWLTAREPYELFRHEVVVRADEGHEGPPGELDSTWREPRAPDPAVLARITGRVLGVRDALRAGEDVPRPGLEPTLLGDHPVDGVVVSFVSGDPVAWSVSADGPEAAEAPVSDDGPAVVDGLVSDDGPDADRTGRATRPGRALDAVAFTPVLDGLAATDLDAAVVAATTAAFRADRDRATATTEVVLSLLYGAGPLPSTTRYGMVGRIRPGSDSVVVLGRTASRVPGGPVAPGGEPVSAVALDCLSARQGWSGRRVVDELRHAFGGPAEERPAPAWWALRTRSWLCSPGRVAPLRHGFVETEVARPVDLADVDRLAWFVADGIGPDAVPRHRLLPAPGREERGGDPARLGHALGALAVAADFRSRAAWASLASAGLRVLARRLEQSGGTCPSAGLGGSDVTSPFGGTDRSACTDRSGQRDPLSRTDPTGGVVVPGTRPSLHTVAGLLDAVSLAGVDELRSQADRWAVTLRAAIRPDGAVAPRAGRVVDGDQDVVPALVLLALGRHAAWTGLWESWDLTATLAWYRRRFEVRRSWLLASWQVQAWSQVHAVSGEQPAADLALEIADWIVGNQVAATGEFLGRDDPPGRRRVHPALTAHGIACALATAERTGDGARARRYRQAWRATMARLQGLTVHEADVPLLAAGAAAVGGVRAGLTSGEQRLDHTSHTLLAMIAGLRAGAGG